MKIKTNKKMMVVTVMKKNPPLPQSKMEKKFDELPDWTFEISEISYGCYRVTGSDSPGRSVERDGTDLDELLKKVLKEGIDDAV